MDGRIEDYGGGIRNSSSLTLERVTVTNNVSIGDPNNNTYYGGGGIFNQSTLTIRDSTIGKNEAQGSSGGGLYNAGNAALSNVTVSANRVTNGNFAGGGIYQASGTLSLVNSTISGNTIPSGHFGAGIRTLTGGSVTNTIFAGNTPDDCGGNGGALTSNGHNISGDSSCEFNSTGDQVNVDPLLGSLTSNGGHTQTHALLDGSPAINNGDAAACPLTDQRGYGRVGVCDIGAYEFGGAAVTIKQGDVNCDDAVTAVDALVILRVIAQLPTTAECVNTAGDVNCDGDKTAVDALGVLRFVAGLPVNQGEPCPDIGTPV